MRVTHYVKGVLLVILLFIFFVLIFFIFILVLFFLFFFGDFFLFLWILRGALFFIQLLKNVLMIVSVELSHGRNVIFIPIAIVVKVI